MWQMNFTFLFPFNGMYANPITVDSSLPKHNILEDEYCEEMHIEVQIVQKEMVLYHDLNHFPDAAIHLNLNLRQQVQYRID